MPETYTPYNPTTGQEYKAGNIARLSNQFKSPEWAGFEQWFKEGRIVKKGQHGVKIMVVFQEKEEEKKAIKASMVFNIEQTEELSQEAKKQHREKKPLETYHIFSAAHDCFEPVKGRRYSFNGLELGYHKADTSWVVTEVTTGAMIAYGATVHEAVMNAENNIAKAGQTKIQELIDQLKAEHGTSPTIVEALPF